VAALWAPIPSFSHTRDHPGAPWRALLCMRLIDQLELPLSCRELPSSVTLAD
jgi:hypothetical protein